MGWWLCVQRALWTKAEWVRVHVGAAMDEEDGGGHQSPSRQLPASHFGRRRQATSNIADDRAKPQCFSDDGFEVTVVTGDQLRLEPRQDVGVSKRALEDPGQCGGSGLVTGD